MDQTCAAVDAWQRFCDRLRGTGGLLLGEAFPSGDLERAEGVRYLGRLAVQALQRHLELTDPDHPGFLRHNDDITKWGAPNVDNTYLSATIDGSGSYTLSGSYRDSGGFILSTSTGGLHLGTGRIFDERSDLDLGMADGTDFEITIGGPERTGAWMPLHDQATHLLVREYFTDWERHRPCGFRIRRTDPGAGAPARATPTDIAAGLDAAGEWVERSLLFWNDYVEGVRRRLPPNELGAPVQNTGDGGAADIAYGAGHWRLGPDEALLVEMDVPDARYWSVQLYSLAWYESLDFANRQTSLNDRQTQVDADGRVRFVVAHEDPGVPNWLDTEGRPEGLVHSRAVWSRRAPAPSSRVVPLAGLDTHLPAGTPHVDRAARERALSARRDHVARRFRQ